MESEVSEIGGSARSDAPFKSAQFLTFFTNGVPAFRYLGSVAAKVTAITPYTVGLLYTLYALQ